ncbi:MAG TPA: molybdenum cofactor guanylyltransferase [Candidatus Acidoferrales bacterium]|nr:molybdenum cofactor guanylyltransferase [Candidatus Acidoferrales bacterium]
MNPNPQIAGFVLAGGASSRMGRAKALLEIGGVPLIVRTARLAAAVAGSATVVGGGGKYRTLGLRVIEDDLPGAGPLGGIATALRASEAPWNLILACDLPYLTRNWLEFLVQRGVASQADAVIPMNTLGAEPLCAVYHKCGEPLIRTAIERGVRKVTDGLKELRVEAIAPAEWKAFDSDGLLFKNMNSPEDYEEAKTRLEADARSGRT